MKKILFISFIFSTIAVSQTLIPKLPQITASSFLLIDAETNKIIAQQNNCEIARQDPTIKKTIVLQAFLA